MRNKVEVYPLAGRFNYQELGFAHKRKMQIGAVLNRSEGMENQIKNPVENVRKENLSVSLDAVTKQPADSAINRGGAACSSISSRDWWITVAVPTY